MGLPMPDPATLVAAFGEAYALIDAVGDDVAIVIRNADGSYGSPIPAKAKVSQFKLDELIAGSPARQGDLRAILRAEGLPVGMRRLEQRDRVQWRGKSYAVMNYDDATHAIAGVPLGVELWLRG